MTEPSTRTRYEPTKNLPLAAASVSLIERTGMPRIRSDASTTVLSVDSARAEERAIRFLKDAAGAVEDGTGDTTTYKTAQRVKDFGVPAEACLRLMLDHYNARCSPPWPSDRLWTKVQNAYKYGKDAPGVAAPETSFGRVEVEQVKDADIPSPAYSDDAMARSVVQDNPNVRHVAPWNKWFFFDGRCWRVDEKLGVFNRTRVGLRSHARACNETVQAKRLGSNATVAAVVNLWRSDPHAAATTDQWDADPWLLCTPGGAVDLRTGALRPNAAGDYCTKITAVAPGGNCPLWLDVIGRTTNGDRDLQNFLQKIFGYALTGDTSEHALFFGYGTGANGKGVLLNTVSGVLGDYAAVASIDAFSASQGDRHPTDLAMLRGARLVASQETEEGKRWAESRIKSLTGGDPITARFMRQDFFTYTPQFKLFVMGNHRPGLRNVDEAIRRRMHLIPFTVTIPESERDTQLQKKLREEWPGILKWAIEGCLLWQKAGLAPPAAVRAATDEYLAAEDALATWIEERCTIGGETWCSGADLFAHWKLWAEKSGEHAGTRKRFGQNLEAHGFKRGREPGTGAKGFVGISPQTADSSSLNHGGTGHASALSA